MDLEKLVRLIKQQSLVPTCQELNPEYSPADNGNYDDAYSDGEDDGEIAFARYLVKECNL